MTDAGYNQRVTTKLTGTHLQNEHMTENWAEGYVEAKPGIYQSEYEQRL